MFFCNLKYIWVVGAMALGFASTANAQQYTLQQVLQQTRNNYAQQHNLYAQIGESARKALWYAYLPQLAVSAQGTTQNKVPELEIPMLPMMDLIHIPKAQYQTYVEAQQLIWDGGRIAAGASLATAKTEAQQQENAITAREAEEHAREAFFGVLMLDQQLALQQNLLAEYDRQVKRLQSAVNEGVATANELDLLRLKQIDATEQQNQLNTARHALVVALLAYMGTKENLPDSSLHFAEPPLPPKKEQETLEQRAELRLLDAEQKVNNAEWEQFRTNLMPTLGLFMRVGYGKPGLNMFSPHADSFYIGGVKLSWNLGKYYQWGQQRKQWKQRQQLLQLKQQDALRQLTALKAQQQAQVKKFASLLQADQQKIALRTQLRNRAQLQVEEGVLSVTDFMEQETALTAAKQEAEIHRLQHLSALYAQQDLYK